ncbi:unnamed protein product [Darwinula stevensoni]|uniref:3-hydroxyisobutyryl-CoA hydrolase, mitochondrial n=1 Tax=Darwinula stevensoni TaxID=69355 RepID=A0A7R9AEC1_9CRUS|nr:unnamed protein product [Darwinula stevensoni]CAG0901763.1 unnamed protein product [Darwinula stevensoni]
MFLGQAFFRIGKGSHRLCHQSMKPRCQMPFSSLAEEEVMLDITNQKGVILLNRTKALNALNLSMIRKVYPKLKRWQSELDLVIIRGAGGKSFCAGGDVRAIVEAGKRGDRLTKDFFREEYMLNYLTGTLKIPYIAIIDGITMGGGFGLSVHGPFRVATENTVFAMPETAIGLFPDVGGSHFLPRLKGKLGLFLALTGQRLTGRDVMSAGIATHMCDAKRVPDLIEDLFDCPSGKEEQVKAVLKKHSDASTVGKDRRYSLEEHLSQIDAIFSADSVEEIVQRLEKDGSNWAKDQKHTLMKMSPTSLKVTFEQLKRGAQLSLKDCFCMEYRLSQRFCTDHDFYEGVRAVLVDKDNNPRWKPDRLEEVTAEKVAHYFNPLPAEEELQLD